MNQDNFEISVLILNFFCKGIFSQVVTEFHIEVGVPDIRDFKDQKRRAFAEKLNLMRFVFHEIRVPLNTLLLGSTLLTESIDLIDQDRDAFDMIRQSSEYMEETLNDIALLQQAEQKLLVLKFNYHNIPDLIRSCIDHCRSLLSP